MNELRVILLVVGAAVLAAVYYFSRPRKPRQAQSRDERRRAASPAEEPETSPDESEWPTANRDDPPPEALKRELRRLGDLISRDRGGGEKPRADEPGAATGEGPAVEPVESRGEGGSEKIVVIYVRARGDEPVAGKKLVEAADKAGLEYGEMNIYHRLDEAGSRECIFSMANMVAPGTLDRARSPGFTTPGVALFLRLPGPLPALDAWDSMLATARRLSELLGAEMLDESHSTLNRQRIQQLREEMREYDRLSTLEIKRS